MSVAAQSVPSDDVSVVPANRATCEDIELVFGRTGDPARCRCEWFKVAAPAWRAITLDRRVARQREQMSCGDPDAVATSGLVA